MGVLSWAVPERAPRPRRRSFWALTLAGCWEPCQGPTFPSLAHGPEELVA